VSCRTELQSMLPRCTSNAIWLEFIDCEQSANPFSFFRTSRDAGARGREFRLTAPDTEYKIWNFLISR
jgi:hypothetical protein